MSVTLLILIYAVAMIVMWESFWDPTNGRWDRLILGSLLIFGVPNGLYMTWLCWRYVRTGE